jgi:hypothetical protein
MLNNPKIQSALKRGFLALAFTVAYCVSILAFVRFSLEAASRFILGEPVVGLVALVITAAIGAVCWQLRGIIKEQSE